jgi:phosphatidylinositol glycan class N
MSIFTLLPANKIESLNMMWANLLPSCVPSANDSFSSSIGGGLILLLGLAYIAFENSLTANSKGGPSTQRVDGTSRLIIGVQVRKSHVTTLDPNLTHIYQVGLVAVAIIVTRSSVISLQAKQGLPLGTQVVGWLTLSKFDLTRLYSMHC